MKKAFGLFVVAFTLGSVHIGCQEPVKPREERAVQERTQQRAAQRPAANLSSVQIGNQVWTNRNYNGTTYRNGDPIPECKTDNDWVQAYSTGKGCWCRYDNNPEFDEYYGKIYNFYAMTDPRGLAPEGWHIPSKYEWADMFEFMGGIWDAQPRLRSKTGWYRDLNGTDDIGFFGVAGGYRTDTGEFQSLTLYGMWWSDLDEEGQTWIQNLSYNEGEPSRRYGSRGAGFSLRLVKD